MKTLITFFLFSLTSLLAFSQAPDSLNQQKVDRIIMTNGEIREGKITAISETSVDFIYVNETLVYHIPTKTIGKIEFSSGRIQQFNAIKPNKKSENSMVNHANKIAIIPFIYVKDGVQRQNDIMEQNAQKEMYKVLLDHAGPMVIQDPNKTVALLRKNNVSDANISTFSIPELANILGVEYLIFGVLSINKKGTTSYSSSYGSTHYSNRNAYGYRTSSTSTQVDYQTTVDVNIYNDHGNQIFTKSKTSFFASQDAYPYTIMYLVKRMPFYTK